MCVRVCVFVRAHVCEHSYMYLCVHAFVCAFVYVCMCAHECEHSCVSVCVYRYTHATAPI